MAVGGASRPALFIHDFAKHDDVGWALKRILKQEVSDDRFLELEPFRYGQEESETTFGVLGRETIAFSKPIPPLAFADPDKVDSILKSMIVYMPTQKQSEVLNGVRPLLINGQAGSGKTTILCCRLALSIVQQRQLGIQEPILYLSYSPRLVEYAKSYVKDILKNLHFEDPEVDQVEFLPFQELLKRYVPASESFEKEDHVSFGRFKRNYELYKRGGPARGISPEVAWHNIRSIMKGACLPQITDQGRVLMESRPPLSKERYGTLARRRREIPEDVYEQMYTIGVWYQNEIINRQRCWDDQDLAWSSLRWLMVEQKRNPAMQLYAEIFCDEVQDLTELEFATLTALCRPPARYAKEGLALALAGDPLQTINPTGFRWDVVGQYIYRIGNESVQRHELEENYRSDRRIVDFANVIQRVRSFYLKQDLPLQEAFIKEGEGDVPHLVVVETLNETNIIADKLKELPPRSATVLWPEEDEEVLKLLKEDPVLARLLEGSEPSYQDLDKIMADLNVWQISDSKGLEYRLVILYKFGEGGVPNLGGN
jgi:hypothetical protein